MICRVSHNIERFCKIISRDFTKILEDFAKYQHTRPISSNSMKCPQTQPNLRKLKKDICKLCQIPTYTYFIFQISPYPAKL